jgi:hypothetical protein
LSWFVTTQDNDTAAMSKVDPVAWAESFNEMFVLMAGDFVTAATRWRARSYVLGLLQAEHI